MTAPEYIQLRAFARVDGLRLFFMWLISFIFYVASFKMPFLSLAALTTAIMTPFFSSRLLRNYRDKALDGIISFRRGWVYVIFHFFYASVLFAFAQYIYFAVLDHGYFMEQISKMFNEANTVQSFQQMGMSQTLNETIADMSQMRPIDLALNIMASNLLIGLVIGMPIGLLAHRKGEPLPPASPQEGNTNA